LLIVAFYTSTSAATVATIVIVAIAIVAFVIVVALRDRRGGRSCSSLPRLPLWHRVRAPSLEASAQKNQLIVVLRSPHIACLLVRVPRYYDWGAHDRRDHVVSIVAMRSRTGTIVGVCSQRPVTLGSMNESWQPARPASIPAIAVRAAARRRPS
jgi:hypothetical protein